MKIYKKPVARIINCSVEKVRYIQNYSDDELAEMIRRKKNQEDKRG